MKTRVFAYPGDPLETAWFLTKEEFLQRYPRKPIAIYSSGGGVEYIEVPPDSILCDACNAVPVEEVCVVGSRAYCEACAKEYILPYLVKE